MFDVNRLQEISAVKATVNEATFYGKNDQLLKCEKLLDEMVDLGHHGKLASSEFNNKEMLVADILGNLYGFYSLTINASIICLVPQNAVQLSSSLGCTLCHASIYKYTKIGTGNMTTWLVDFDKHHKGIKFAPNVRYSMRMFLSVDLFRDYGEHSLTGGEILAIMLHEIGHNFYIGPVHDFTKDVISMMTAPDIIMAVANYMNSFLVIEGTQLIDDYVPDSFKSTINSIMNNISIITTVGNQLVTLLTIFMIPMCLLLGVAKLAALPLQAISAIAGYDPEKYSDAFATSYGYGTELSSALTKMTTLRLVFVKTRNGQNVLHMLYLMVTLPIAMLNMILDPHPNSQGRLMNDIKYMEAAGKDIKDQKLKKEYDETLKQMKDLRKSYENYSGTDMLKQDARMNTRLQNLLHISDPKDLLSTLNANRDVYKNLDTTTK